MIGHYAIGALALGLTEHAVPPRDDVTAAVDFSLTLTSGMASLETEQHDLGGGVVATVATYDEYHTENPRHETQEMLAYAGDQVTFDATGERMVATRTNAARDLVAIAQR